MIRLVLFFVFLGAVSLGAAWFADNPGDVLIHWFGYEMETSVGGLLLLIVGLGLFLFLAIFVLQIVLRGPAAWARYRTEQRRIKRERALVKGFAAVSVGEPETARKYLGAAKGGDPGLRQMLGAQIAVLEQDDESAELHYREMLRDPDTEFLGLRGLFETAARLGDREAALEFATRAFQLKPRSAWVADSLFRVQTQTGAWALAHSTVSTAQRAGGISAKDAKRREAVLFLAEAIQSAQEGEDAASLKLAEKALTYDKGLTQAAILAAEGHKAKEEVWAAAGVIESAWRHFPHPRLAEVYATLKPEEDANARSRRLIGLGQFNSDHVESRVLIAEEAIKLGELRRARRVLKPLLESPSARVCLLMGEIEDRAGKDPEALTWRTKAIIAPRDNEWTCSDCDHENLDWHPVCPVCGGFDTYIWGTDPNAGEPDSVVLPVEGDAEEDGIEETADIVATAEEVSDEPNVASESEAVVEAPAEPAPVAVAQTAASSSVGAAEIYVPPRPPDDPGPADEPKATSASPFPYSS